MKNWNDPYEPTPESFHFRVEATLSALQSGAGQERRVSSFRFSRRGTLILAFALLLAIGAACAGSRLGVMDFLSDRRVWNGPSEEELRPGVVSVSSVQWDSDLLIAEVRDAYVDDAKLAICLHIEPREPDAYRLLYETAIGTNGEHFDRIWWDGSVYTFPEWLPEGKKMLVLNDRELRLGNVPVLVSLDWLPEEQGATLTVEIDWKQTSATQRAQMQLSPEGTLPARLTLSCRIYGEEKEEQSVLAFQLPLPDEVKERIKEGLPR